MAGQGRGGGGDELTAEGRDNGAIKKYVRAFETSVTVREQSSPSPLTSATLTAYNEAVFHESDAAHLNKRPGSIWGWARVHATPIPFVPPDPSSILRDLREQLEQIRLLIHAYPSEPSYLAVAEYVEAAIAKLEGALRQERPLLAVNNG